MHSNINLCRTILIAMTPIGVMGTNNKCQTEIPLSKLGESIKYRNLNSTLTLECVIELINELIQFNT